MLQINPGSYSMKCVSVCVGGGEVTCFAQVNAIVSEVNLHGSLKHHFKAYKITN